MGVTGVTGVTIVLNAHLSIKIVSASKCHTRTLRNISSSHPGFGPRDQLCKAPTLDAIAKAMALSRVDGVSEAVPTAVATKRMRIALPPALTIRDENQEQKRVPPKDAVGFFRTLML
jgi:hypothetical protein